MENEIITINTLFNEVPYESIKVLNDDLQLIHNLDMLYNNFVKLIPSPIHNYKSYVYIYYSDVLYSLQFPLPYFVDVITEKINVGSICYYDWNFIKTLPVNVMGKYLVERDLKDELINVICLTILFNIGHLGYSENAVRRHVQNEIDEMNSFNVIYC